MKEKKDVSFKEYIKIAFWSLKIVWQISPSLMIINVVSEILRNLRSLVNVYITARLIDELIRMATTQGTEVNDLIPFLIILLLVNVAFSALEELRHYAGRVLRTTSRSYLQKIAYEKCNFLGPQTLELPEVANNRQKMMDWINFITEISSNVVRIISSFIQALVAGLILLSQVPLVVPLILALSVVYFFQRKYYFKKDFEWQTSDKHLMQRRKSYWTSSMLTDTRNIGEISITGAFKYLDNIFNKFFNYYNEGYAKIMRDSSLSGFLLSILSNVIILFGYLQVFAQLLLERISIGDTTFFMSSINNFYDGIQSFFAESVAFRDFVMKAREVYNFFELKPVVEDGDIKLPRLDEAPEIEVKNISFYYPNSKHKIFDNFSLKIKPGEKIAIVGANGAGKTTLVKLLSRIYDPQEGHILVNGVDLKDIKLNDWYKNLGVLFQEYNFYGQLTVEENIYLGKSVKKMDREKMIEASKNADAHDFVQKYDNGYKTIMSERFEEGIRPSNGQRQKIAIARFFYRNAPVAIFDEPTSAIDAESEYRIFNRIYDFFKNKTVVIISHRFSTVRNADRIIVLDEGKIVEEGTHEELVKKEGKYFSAFTKQAEGYVS
ncbi:MAG: ABC transporter ATP-binding protein [Candidatus Dojkabacteria bacterium]